MNKRWFWLVIVLLTLVSSSVIGCEPDYAYSFEKAECQFEVPTDEEMECGYLVVPQNRKQKNRPNIKLHVAVVHSKNENPAPDPVVILNGGPGGYTLDSIGHWLDIFTPIRNYRDLIIIDQRGTGYSQPSLNCPEAEDQEYQDWGRNISYITQNQNYLQALQACHDRLIAEGIDLSSYTSATNASDVEDLRKVLGYSQWNLYGISYGTRLALTIMRDYPAGIRSVVLDSVYPTQVDLYTTMVPNFERSLNMVFSDCKASPKCNEDFPDIKTTFYALVDQLDTQPIEFNVFQRLNGKAYKAILNGDRLIMTVFSMLYSTDQIPSLPRHITNIKQGRTFTFSMFLQDVIFSNDYFSEGMNYSIQCNEEIPFSLQSNIPDIITKSDARLIEALSYPQEYYRLCSEWNTIHTSDKENKAVSSDIPALILSGEFDPITPPEWGQLAAETLSNSQFLEFPGFGHGVLGSGSRNGECSKQIVNTFLADPNTTVDSSCISSIEPPFNP